MRFPPLQWRTLAVLAVVVPLLAGFAYVALRSGPLAPVAVTVATVQSQRISPALFGIGTVEARHTFRIGPTSAGRLKTLNVQVGDRVEAGQVLGEMDPVDLDERIGALRASLARAEAQLRDADARLRYARVQARRYEQLLAAKAVSAELTDGKRQELAVAEATQETARAEIARLRAEREALLAQRANLRLIAPVAGMITARKVDPGTTVVAGEAVVELIDPESLWLNVRFDQSSARGLAPDLPVRIVLRSRPADARAGRVLRLEPLADAVTEELLAKVVFEQIPSPLPPVGELVEVTVALPHLPEAPVIPNAAVRRVDGRLGVWRLVDGEPRFEPVALGVSDLDGRVQVREGLQAGGSIVVYSAKPLTGRSRITVVDSLPGVDR